MVEGNTLSINRVEAHKSVPLLFICRMAMVRAVMILGCLLLLSPLVKAQYLPNYADSKLTIGVSGSYSSNDVSWSIAGNGSGQKPNIYSELKWVRQRGPGAVVDINYKFYHHFFAEVGFAGNAINSGYVTDTDYSTDDRTGQVFYIKLPSTKGSTVNGHALLGYQFKVTKYLDIGLAAGYIVNGQNLYLTDPENDPALNSSYSTNWKGLMVRLTPVYHLSNKLSFDGCVSYSQLKYNATANWDLISEFAHPESFKHNANGYGLDSGVGVSYRFIRPLSVRLGASWHQWETGNGIDKLFLANGQTRVTQLNGVKSNGYQLLCGMVLAL